MGCDIHAHIEIKINNKWEHYSTPPIQRCYGLFAKICGVRNNEDWGIIPIVLVRGIPEDCSIVTLICSRYEEGHSHTWMTKEEFKELILWANDNINIRQSWNGEFEHKQIGYINGNCVYLNSCNHAPEITDMRFICWFDN